MMFDMTESEIILVSTPPGINLLLTGWNSLFSFVIRLIPW
jgi:hypothetical protein